MTSTIGSCYFWTSVSKLGFTGKWLGKGVVCEQLCLKFWLSLTAGMSYSMHEIWCSLESLTHYCTWPAEGRSVLHIERSWPAIRASLYVSRRSSKPKLHLKDGEKRFSIWRMEFLPCNVARSWHWFRQMTAPCRGSGMTCHWIRRGAHELWPSIMQ